ncbi:MAG: AarF/ABC1/UbiB kinase family protein [Methylobacterium sp.]|nr:AarF/ABC1/UbiB kinase family protein [Methylobacterium sp.]MCA3636268.1 AarF/ABC1/UbiB kinase family protein [Methylobacterium sp.]MCA3638906.1 AarF/ABC1/UbiB kinase family protein [Methylobacterium sp.]
MSDTEQNRFSARASRYARVGANVGGVAARIAGGFLVGRSSDGDRRNAAALTAALGGLKGPLMKVAQLIATIPEAVPAEYAEELRKLQSEAPPMGWAFVKRRMTAELGADWVNRFGSFEKEPAAAASLGQVHRATTLDGRRLACKLQYPDMESAVEADLRQLDLLFSIHRRMSNVIDTREIKQEIAARIREELDYTREAKHARLYRSIFPSDDLVRVPKVEDSLSTRRLLSLEWLDGEKMLAFKGESEEVRNRLAKAMFRAWWHPFAQVGIIHGDPHLGNYTVFRDDGGEPSGINLLDYGCIRIFPPSFVEGVIDLYHGLLAENRAQIVSAYETWGFKNLKNDQIDVLSLWARFIFGPLLDDRVRTIADGVSPGEYGRREAFQVHQALKEKGPVTIPREFVFMDRAAIGLGGVFLHLDARLNFHRLFNAEIEAFAVAQVKARQQAKLTQFGLP